MPHPAPASLTWLRSATISRASPMPDEEMPDGEKKRDVVTVAFSAGSAVERTDFWTGERWIESLAISEDAIDSSRIDSAGIPMLRDHIPSIDSVIGRTIPGTFRLESGDALVDVELSDADEDAGVVGKIRSGLIRSVSVGYSVQTWAIDKPKGGPETRTAIRWTPMEISAVAIPADPRAQVRSADGRPLEMTMPQPPAPQPTPDVAALRAQVQAELLQRQTEIEAAGRALGATPERVRALVTDAAVTVDAARAALINERVQADAAAHTAAPVARITVGREERDFRRDAFAAALAVKAGSPGVSLLSEQAQAEGRRMSRLSAAGLFRQMLTDTAQPHERADLAYISDAEAVRRVLSQRAQSSSDFPYVLGQVIEKSLIGAYQQHPKAYQMIAKGATIANLRTRYPTILSGAVDLEDVTEGADYPQRPLLESRESYSLTKRGQIIALTLEAVLKDDLSAFSSIPQALAAAAVRKENAVVFGILNANAAMADGVALFHASHANLLGSGAAPSAAQLAATDNLIRVQTGLNSEKLALEGAVLIVPAALYHTAAQLFDPRYVPTAATGVLAGNLANLKVVSHPVLDGTSAVVWYMCADPNVAPAIEYAFPSDVASLSLTEDEGFDNDTKKWKATHWFGAVAVDHRPIAKNPGA